LTKCKHIFHRDCIDQVRCPSARTSVYRKCLD
jgi:hypothetical protein